MEGENKQNLDGQEAEGSYQEQEDKSQVANKFFKFMLINGIAILLFFLLGLFSSKHITFSMLVAQFRGITNLLIFYALVILFSTLGAFIGDYIRKRTMPQAFITGGGILDILKIKIFWAIGPQCVGYFIGLVSAAMTAKKIGIPGLG